jgi:hypothetical protein
VVLGIEEGRRAGRAVATGIAEEPEVADHRPPAMRLWDDVVDLYPEPRPADAAGVDLPLAASTIPFPDLALHGGGDVVGVGRVLGVGRHGPWLLDEGRVLGAPGEEEVEAGGKDGLGVGHGVGECEPRVLQLLQEGPGDGEVQAGLGRCERLDLEAARRRRLQLER